MGAYLLYMLYGHEKNAFFATIANKARKYDSWAVAVEELKKDKVYKEYINLFAICKLKEEELKTNVKKLNSKLDKSIVDNWRKLNKSDAPDKKIWKTIIYDVYKTKEKLDKIRKIKDYKPRQNSGEKDWCDFC